MSGSGIVRRRMATGAAGVLAALAWSAAPASAQDECGTVVVDETGRLDVAEVEEAAAALEGTTVRVRFYQDTPSGSLDADAQDLIDSCWPGDGDSQPDLLFLGVALGQRRTFVEAGPASPLSDAQIDEITSEVINERLADGEFTAAVVEGLEAIDERSEEALAGGDAGGGDDGGATDGDGVPVAVPLGVLGGLAVAGVGGLTVARRRRLNQRRQAVDELMVEPLGRAGDLRERNRQLDLQCSSMEQVLAGSTLNRLGHLRGAARDAGSAADASVVLLRRALPDGVEQADHDSLDEAETRIKELALAVAAHDESLSTLDRAVRRLEELRVTLPAKRQLLQEELADTRTLAADRSAEGWRTEEQVARIDRVEADLASIDLSPLRLDLDTLSERIEQDEADLFTARHALQTLAERRAGLESWAEQVGRSVDLERQRARAAGAELERLATIHDRASFAPLIDNPSIALAELDRAEAVRAATVAGPLAAQEWDRAGRQLEEAGLHLFRADAELDEIDKTSVELADARARAARTLEQAQRALDEVSSFVATHDEDLGPRFDTEPAALRSALSGLGSELRRPRPNYLRVLQTSEQAMVALQNLMAEAQDEQARVSALRRQVEQEEGWAVMAVARARQALGWQLFASGDAHELDDLEDALAALPNDLEARLDAVRIITERAQHIEMRIVSRRRRGSVWIVGGPFGGMGGGGWGGGGGGGGSSGGGGFGGGSFGGGGFGGGGFGGGGFGGGGGGGGSSW